MVKRRTNETFPPNSKTWKSNQTSDFCRAKKIDKIITERKNRSKSAKNQKSSKMENSALNQHRPPRQKQAAAPRPATAPAPRTNDPSRHRHRHRRRCFLDQTLWPQEVEPILFRLVLLSFRLECECECWGWPQRRWRVGKEHFQ